ncbi:YigZ family protein [Aliiglaciecola sp. CAU 1673]|uniref:YigZ family protein n=1 Tax=Aliiglaciecola sp. CAU 1673 TaxID=3032595 RepID=UPI0023DC868D|nr:YigZ family protein [Aliiglaciecola sp. CAU 1673]MDF2178376.1 YigZ family protein [Aliiglaciecola sp. CAU 1673]
MQSGYPIPSGRCQFELEIKRSKFLCIAEHAPTPASAQALIQSLRAAHPGANHVCWAYIAGAPNGTDMSMSDDGEPSGTAGRPMLNLLQHSGLGEIVVAVVRYFGGTKLGTGGLQRAYSDAVAGVLEIMETTLKVHRAPLILSFDYALEAKVRHVLSQFDVTDEHFEYGQQVTLSLRLEEKTLEDCAQRLTDHCAGAISIQGLSDKAST